MVLNLPLPVVFSTVRSPASESRSASDTMFFLAERIATDWGVGEGDCFALAIQLQHSTGFPKIALKYKTVYY